LSLILSGIFIAYIGHAIWTLVQLFVPPKCQVGEKCLTSFLHNKPDLQVGLTDMIILRCLNMWMHSNPWEYFRNVFL